MNVTTSIRPTLAIMAALTLLPLASNAQKPAVKNVAHTASKAGKAVGKDTRKLAKGTAKDARKLEKSVGKDTRKLAKGTAKDARKLEKGVGKALGIK